MARRFLFSRSWKLALLLAFAAPPPDAAARVYWLWGADRHGAASGGQPGWHTAYKSAMDINGGSGEVEVLACTFPLEQTLRALRDAYAAQGAKVVVWSGQSMGWGVALFDGRVVRFLVTQWEPARYAMVFRIDQTAEDFRKSLQPPAEHRLAELPAPPGARPMLYVRDRNRGAQLELSRVAGGGRDAAGQVAADAKANGWAEPLPAGDGAPAVMLTRGREVAVVRETSRDGRSVLLRYHQSGDR